MRTPHIDRFAAQAASLTNFHVMPVCPPTRACLMTGRYNYRTGVVDVFLGRPLIRDNENTQSPLWSLAFMPVSEGNRRWVGRDSNSQPTP